MISTLAEESAALHRGVKPPRHFSAQRYRPDWRDAQHPAERSNGPSRKGVRFGRWQKRLSRVEKFRGMRQAALPHLLECHYPDCHFSVGRAWRRPGPRRSVQNFSFLELAKIRIVAAVESDRAGKPVPMPHDLGAPHRGRRVGTLGRLAARAACPWSAWTRRPAHANVHVLQGRTPWPRCLR